MTVKALLQSQEWVAQTLTVVWAIPCNLTNDQQRWLATATQFEHRPRLAGMKCRVVPWPESQTISGQRRSGRNRRRVTQVAVRSFLSLVHLLWSLLYAHGMGV